MNKKGKSKQEKGITLIALIITIVVLMILAAVAINSITNDGILGQAESVKNTYTEAQNEEQKMLDYYELLLEGRAWTQNGKTVSGNGQTLSIGDKVTLKVGTADAVAYSAGDYTGDWVVLGAEYGKLLLVSATNVVSSVPLRGRNGGNFNGTEYVGGYYNGAAALDTICSSYLNTTYADSARSITVEDINRVTKYVPTTGATYTITAETVANDGWEKFEHVDGRIIGQNGVESITETSTYYYYQGSKYITDTTDPAYLALFSNTDWGSGSYWLASTCVDVNVDPGGYTTWDIRSVSDGEVNAYGLWYCTVLTDSTTDFGARAVVSLKSDVQVVKA